MYFIFVIFAFIGLLSPCAAGISISLTDFLVTSGGVKVVGAAGSKAGIAVSMIGDYNKDGKQDFAIAAPLMTVNSKVGCGMVLIVLGKDGAWTEIDLSTASSGFLMRRVIGAAAGDNAGSSVGPAGDVNNDGVDDVLIGAPNADPNSKSNSGRIYVLFGKATTSAYTDMNLASFTTGASTGFTVAGPSIGSSLGTVPLSIRPIGDVNGDKIDDFIVSIDDTDTGAGTVWILFGKTTTFSNINLASLGSAGVFLKGVAKNFYFGWSIDGVGDFNGDGINDIVIGERQHTSGETMFCGAAYLLYGSTSLANMAMASFVTGPKVIRFIGSASEEVAGSRVSGAGDINGDGKMDILISGNADLPLRFVIGLVYVIYGTNTQFTADINLSTLRAANLGFAIYGAVNNELLGDAISRGGDLDQDGYDDFVIASRFSVYILYGSPIATTENIDLLSYTGKVVSFHDIVAVSVSGEIDVTGDNIPDLLVGVPKAASQAGVGYLVKGPIYPEFSVPSEAPSSILSITPTCAPSLISTTKPSLHASVAPSLPTMKPVDGPTAAPSASPSGLPSALPSNQPHSGPSAHPSVTPVDGPTAAPSASPSGNLSILPSAGPSVRPSMKSSTNPSVAPSAKPSFLPGASPSAGLSTIPSVLPSASPSESPSILPTAYPSALPTVGPSSSPTLTPTAFPTATPTVRPTAEPQQVVLDVQQDINFVNKADYDSQKVQCNKTIQHTVAEGMDGVTPERVTDIVVEEEEEEGGRSAAGNIRRAAVSRGVSLKYKVTVYDPLLSAAMLTAQLKERVRSGDMDVAFRTFALHFNATSMVNGTFGEPLVSSLNSDTSFNDPPTDSELVGLVIGIVLFVILLTVGVWLLVIWLRTSSSEVNQQGEESDVGIVAL